MSPTIDVTLFDPEAISYVLHEYNEYIDYLPHKNVFVILDDDKKTEIEIKLTEYHLRYMLNKKTQKLQEAIVGRALYGVTMDELDQLID